MADRTWDTLFETASQMVADGFVAEMAIPFKSLRYPSPAEGQPHRWGFQIVREIKSKEMENQVWAPMSRDESSFYSQMGLLEGMTNISTSRNLEVLPSFTAIQHGEIDPTRPAFVNQNAALDVGVNVKYGVSPNLTADFTVNPDFSQIESDQPQIEVNQRFPILFPELRPFFVEGAEIFTIPAPVTFVHTRTIVDPDYGTKLSGQIGRFSVGLLTANDRAPGKVDDPTDPALDRTAQTFIARAQYDLQSESNLGVIFTDREFMDRWSRVFGFDTNFRLSPTLVGDFRGVRSLLKGLGEDEATDGHMFATRLQWSGRNVGWSVTANETSPEFATDVGFVRRTDQRSVNANTSYRFWPQRRVLSWGPQVNYGRTYDFEGVLTDEISGLGLNFSFIRNIGLNVNLNRSMERFAGTEFQKTGFFVFGNVNASRRYSFGGNLSMGKAVYYAGRKLGDQLGWNVNTTFRPTERIQTNLSFSSTRLTDPDAGDLELFDVKIARAITNVQFTDRLGLRNITEYNTQDATLDLNVLLQYRVNAGTVFFVGYDDHYQQADRIEGDRYGDGIDEQLFYTNPLRRTNRAIFLKAQYLLRY
ncbi:MAG: hypothetical protein EXR92_07950 [Gemmatimonadetes bacterium]|nr:hypothetical protein [Gemmatimonadota bacterium]